MIKVLLQTADGKLVAEKEILPFKTLPTVLMWGIRTFVAVDEGYGHIHFDGVYVYREAFAWHVGDGNKFTAQLALDKHTVAEQAFKAGYVQGYQDGDSLGHHDPFSEEKYDANPVYAEGFNQWFLTWSGFGQRPEDK